MYLSVYLFVYGLFRKKADKILSNIFLSIKNSCGAFVKLTSLI